MLTAIHCNYKITIHFVFCGFFYVQLEMLAVFFLSEGFKTYTFVNGMSSVCTHVYIFCVVYL